MGAVAKMIKLPVFTERMAWERGGVVIDEFVEYLSVHEPRVHFSYSERGLRVALRMVLGEKLNLDVFGLQAEVGGKYVVRKYFLGAEPDLKAVISEVIAVPELSAKMEWENEGLTMDEIMTAVIKSYPDAHTLSACAGFTE